MIAAFKRSWVQFALIGVAAVWGGTFVMVKDAVASYPLYSFLGWRFGVAIVAFLVMFPQAVRRLDRAVIGSGVLAGAFLCAGYIFQTWGLSSTTASKAAFITGMFVVITPVMQAVLFRHLPGSATLAGILIAVAGLWLLSGASAGGWNVGDSRVLMCAVAYSGHMIVLGGLGRRHDVFALTLVQLVTTAAVCAAIALATEPIAVPSQTSVWVALLVTGVFATAVAFAVQTYAQRHIPPARTALILISEPAFGGLFGWIAGEAIGLRGLAGASLILAGMIAAEIVGTRAAPSQHVALEAAIEGPAVPVMQEAPDDAS